MKSTKNDYTTTKIENSEKLKETITDLDPDDIPLDVTYSQEEVLEKLQSLNISFSKHPMSTDRLNLTYVTKLKQFHPIHQYLKQLNNSNLKDIANKIRVTFNHRRDRMCATIAKFFFSANPC